LDLEIVGRDRELGSIEGTLDALDAGAAGFVTVEGEPGIGKTRLLQELRARANERGHLVLAGAAAEFERDMPFSVWVDALDPYVQSLEAHEAWDDDLTAELGRVLPSLRVDGDAGAIADERYRTHRAMRRLLALIADPQPLVLVLDDLHWSDPASVELLGSLARRPPERPVLVAAGFRPGRVAERLAKAWAGVPVTRIELVELSEGEAAELLDGVDAAAMSAIYRHSGGNPFYLEQLGRAPGGFHAGGEDRAGVGVPAAVAGAIAAELDSLSAESRAFLDAAAVAGEPFEPDLAAAVASQSQAQALDALDDLLELDLVRPTQVPRRFTFRHPLVRRAVYESTRGGWRLAAHARAAEALGSRGADAAERAHHVEQSAAQADEAALAVLLEAGRIGAARAPATAVRWFEAALRLLPAGDAERQVGVRVELASALRSAGDLERCRTTVLDAMTLLPLDAVARRVELIALCAAVEHWQGKHRDAHGRLARAWGDLSEGERGTPAAAALEVELAVDGLYSNDFEQARARGEGALATARALGDRSLVAAAAAALALAESSAGRIAAAREHRAEALELVERMPDAELASRLETLYYLGWAENYLEHYDEAIAHAERGVAIARGIGEGRLLVPLMLLRGYPLEMQGRLREAVEICEAAVEVARLATNPHYLFWALFEVGWARYFSGDLDEAVAACEESARVGGRLSGGTMPSAGGGPGWALAVARFERGEVEPALALMHEIGGENVESWIPPERCFNFENLALAELARGGFEAAEDCASRAEAEAKALGLSLSGALALRTRAAVLLAGGDAAGAVAAAAGSLAAGEAIGAGLQVAFSRSLLGQALAAAGDRTRAISELREAERALDACGSVRMRDQARRELRKLGARAEVRGPATAEDSGLASLTTREREIADLITDRLTNGEIAERLFLSKKTIESHTRNLFMKLGASSRVEVARMIDRERSSG
jgi:DNA-binding CsgD family transcriptional regulator/tetratricopeptide (TPR) repeat protein